MTLITPIKSKPQYIIWVRTNKLWTEILPMNEAQRDKAIEQLKLARMEYQVVQVPMVTIDDLFE